MEKIKSVLFKNSEYDYICLGVKKIIVKKNLGCITDKNYMEL